MKFHIITSGNIKNLKTSYLASDRLRLDYVYEAAKQIGYDISGGNSIPNADVYFFSAITKEIDENIISELYQKNKIKKIKIIADYTDDWLSNSKSENKKIYEQLINLGATFSVPTNGLANQLENYVKEIYIIPDGIDKIPNVKPKLQDNKIKNVLWHGHASNIFSLMRIISEDLVDFDFNLHLVTSHTSAEILTKSKFNQIPKCKPIFHKWSIKKLIEVSSMCDFAILPINKKWASENRLITTFRLGLPVIAETITAYKKFSNFYSDFKKDEIIEMFRNPNKSFKNVERAQKIISYDYNPEKITQLWKASINKKY